MIFGYRWFKQKKWICNHTWIDGTPSFVRIMGKPMISHMRRCLICGEEAYISEQEQVASST